MKPILAFDLWPACHTDKSGKVYWTIPAQNKPTTTWKRFSWINIWTVCFYELPPCHRKKALKFKSGLKFITFDSCKLLFWIKSPIFSLLGDRIVIRTHSSLYQQCINTKENCNSSLSQRHTRLSANICRQYFNSEEGEQTPTKARVRLENCHSRERKSLIAEGASSGYGWLAGSPRSL